MSTSVYSNNQTINRIAKRLIKAGWTVMGHRKHVKLLSPCTRQRVIVPSTPSDRRAEYNFVAEMRRMGIDEQLIRPS